MPFTASGARRDDDAEWLSIHWQAPNAPGGEGAAPESDPSATAREEAARQGSTRRTGLRILFAEDDDLVARSTSRLLKQRGHEVTHAPDGAAALECFRTAKIPFDALLLDVDMPRLDGIGLAREVLASGYKGRIVIVSGRASPAATKAARELGLAGFVTKPFSSDDLIAALTGKTNA